MTMKCNFYVDLNSMYTCIVGISSVIGNFLQLTNFVQFNEKDTKFSLSKAILSVSEIEHVEYFTKFGF